MVERAHEPKTSDCRLKPDNNAAENAIRPFVFSKNLTSVIASTTKNEIAKKSESLVYVNQINFAQALSKMKNTIILLFKRSAEKWRLKNDRIQSHFPMHSFWI
jgi:hypothetical protein